MVGVRPNALIVKRAIKHRSGTSPRPSQVGVGDRSQILRREAKRSKVLGRWYERS